MFLRNLSVPIKTIKTIRSKELAAALDKLEIKTASNMLLHYPRDWEDFSVLIPFCDYYKSDICTIAVVLSKTWIGYGKERKLKIKLEDDSGVASLIFYNVYNRSWLYNNFIIGSQYGVWGKFSYNYNEIQSSSFETEEIEKKVFFNRILPVYPLSKGLSQKFTRELSLKIINQYAKDIDNELPSEIISRLNLLSKSEAIRAIHFPSSINQLEKAKRTLIYEELFYLEIMIARRSMQRRKKNVKIPKTKTENIKIEDITVLQKRLIERLPFSLTSGQIETVKEINHEMNLNIPMARLLQGDVGSGKTLVSFLAALRTVEEGFQAVIMAPTELLARQHAENAARLLEPLGVRVAYLAGNIKMPGRRELLKNLAEGQIDILLGTHALFSKDVIYKNLKLIVIDEQHRFGVMQRSLIMSKGENASLLMMSATPIPRTLALTIFGDMDVSTIKDMPLGRKPVITHLNRQSNEMIVYDFIRKELEAGRQAYFVYPLIEEDSKLAGTLWGDLKDAVSMSQRLSNEIFPEFKTELIHSKLSEEQKHTIMSEFRKGNINVLSATSVVEVGVDVPNATCMVIEHSERFGLSALHQLRGRVGRGNDQSYCFLVYSDDLSDEGKARMKAMYNNTDGFIIAEEDLKMRGPGLIAGTQQSGYLVLGIANPVRDLHELERARNDAFNIIENDPDLLLEDHQVIARVLDECPPFNKVAL